MKKILLSWGGVLASLKSWCLQDSKNALYSLQEPVVHQQTKKRKAHTGLSSANPNFYEIAFSVGYSSTNLEVYRLPFSSNWWGSVSSIVTSKYWWILISEILICSPLYSAGFEKLGLGLDNAAWTVKVNHCRTRIYSLCGKVPHTNTMNTNFPIIIITL